MTTTYTLTRSTMDPRPRNRRLRDVRTSASAGQGSSQGVKVDVPTRLSQLEDDLGSHPVHTHDVYLKSANFTAANIVSTLGNTAVNAASKLANVCTIWGQNFDGSGNVSGALSGATTGNFSDAITLSGTTNTKRRIYFGSSAYFIELDANNYLHTNVGFYSDSFVSAKGLNAGGGGGGSLNWSELEEETSVSHIIHSSHLPSNITGLVSRVTTLEGSSVTGIATTGSGNAVTSVSKSGNTITFTKGSSFPVLDNGKIPMSYLPDVVLGQVIYGGTLGANALATLTANAKAKLGTTASTLTLSTGSTGTGGYTKNEGIYYIASTSQTFGSISLQVGDWLLSTGGGWTKIDNTDAVTGVKGNAESSYRIGNINITPANIGKATTSALGCVQIGSGLSVDANGIVSITASNIVSALGNTAVNRATADASGNTITSTYVSGVAINGDRLRVTKNGGNTDLTIPYALASNMVRNSGEIATETSIAQDGLRYYTGNGAGWTGAESTMAYSAILAIGSPSRGFQMWAQRGDGVSGSINFHVGNGGGTAWSGRRVILDSENYSSYFGYIGKTKVQASSALQTLTGIQSLEVQPTASAGAPVIDFQGGGNNFINIPTNGSLVFSVGGASYTKEHFKINSDGLTLSKTIYSGSSLMYQWRGSSTVNSAGYNAYFAYASGDIYIATYGNLNTGKTVLLETYDTDIMHRKNGTNHKIWDASNSNLSTVDWAAKELNVRGSVNIDSNATGGDSCINYNRAGNNYVNVPTGGALVVSVGGVASNNTRLSVESGGVYPGSQNGTVNLGASGLRWNNFYSKTIDISGNSTIGGTLNVNGQTTIGNGTNGAVLALYGKTNSSYSYYLRTDTARVLRIMSSKSGADVKYIDIDANGNIHAGGGILSDSYITAKTVGNTSDLRLKDIKEKVSLTSEQIASLSAIRFSWKDSGEPGAGGIAQEMQGILPELVHESGGYLSMEYQNASYIMCVSLAKEIVRLKNRIKTLEAN